MIVGTTILKKRGNVAPLNARKSADVADQYYRSATIGNSQRDARGLKFGRRSGVVAGAMRVWRRASRVSNVFEKENGIIIELCKIFLLFLVLN